MYYYFFLFIYLIVFREEKVLLKYIKYYKVVKEVLKFKVKYDYFLMFKYLYI